MSRADDLWQLLQDALLEEGRQLSELWPPAEELVDMTDGPAASVYWVWTEEHAAKVIDPDEDEGEPLDPRGEWFEMGDWAGGC